MKILSTPYFDNNQLKEVATPTASTDAANKQYVDSKTFICIFTADTQGETISCDKPISEIKDAFNAGKRVIGIGNFANVFQIQDFYLITELTAVTSINQMAVTFSATSDLLFAGLCVVYIKGGINENDEDEWEIGYLFNADDKNKLESVEWNAEPNVQSDWNEADTDSDTYILNKPTIPAAVSGTNDGINWTSLTIGNTTKAIPSGGGGGLANYDFTHTANTTVSTASANIIFDGNERGSQMITVSDDIELNIQIDNGSDNYIWVKNEGSSDIDVTFNDIWSTKFNITSYHLPDDGCTISVGKIGEIGVVANADGVFITYRTDLSSTDWYRFVFHVSSADTTKGTATLTNGNNGVFRFNNDSAASEYTANIVATPAANYSFIRWEASVDGTTWSTASEGATASINLGYYVLLGITEFYYRAVFASGLTVSVAAPRKLDPSNDPNFVNAQLLLSAGGQSSTISLSVSPNTTVNVTTTGNIGRLWADYNPYSGSSGIHDYYVAFYEYSTDNGSTWSEFSSNTSITIQTNTLVRAVQIGECYTLTVTANDGMYMMQSSMDYCSVSVMPEGGTSAWAISDVVGPSYGGYEFHLPVYYGANLDIEAYFEDLGMSYGTPNYNIGEFYFNDSSFGYVSSDYYPGSIYKSVKIGEDPQGSADAVFALSDCYGSVTFGSYEEIAPGPDDPMLGDM